MPSGSIVFSLCEEVFDWRLREFPEFATFCGVHDADDQLNDHSVEAFLRREGEVRAFLDRCLAIDSTSLSADDQLNLGLLREDLETYLRGAPSATYVYPVNYHDGMPLEFDLLTSWMKFNTTSDYQKYLSRVKALPQRFQSDIGAMRHGIEKGLVYHSASLEGLVEQLEKMEVEEPTKTTFYAPFVKRAECVEESDWSAMEHALLSCIVDQIQPGIRELRTFLTQDYLPACRPDVGLSSLQPNGYALYDICLKYFTSVDLSVHQIHNIGLREMEKIRAEMEQVKDSTGFEGDLRAFIHFLRTDPQFYYPDKESLMAAYRDVTYNQIRPVLHKLFHKIPAAKLEIEMAPPSMANAPMGYYLSGTPDGSRPGKVYVNTHDLTNCPTYDVMNLALHEGEPGHHFQGMYALEMADMPRFRRHMEDMYYNLLPMRFSVNCAYCEGWGLYCEYLGIELGLYKDPYSRFGQLSFDMHRACRLVADTGLHAFGWSRERAVDLFRENTALSEVAIQNEVRRYITWPGQACAYKIGELKIQELRQKASDKLGARFDVRDFHQEVLQCGMVPLSALERIIDSYITRQLASQ